MAERAQREPEELEILGDNRFERWTKTRAGSRAVVVRNGEILLSRETVSGWYLIPGGGQEAGETPEACCVREVEEETGLLVRPLRCFLILSEYYEDVRYISRYYVCEPAGEGRIHLTAEEKRRGAEPCWLPLAEAVDIFSRHQEYADVSEEKRGSYLREYMALTEYVRQSSVLIQANQTVTEFYSGQ